MNTVLNNAMPSVLPMQMIDVKGLGRDEVASRRGYRVRLTVVALEHMWVQLAAPIVEVDPTPEIHRRNLTSRVAACRPGFQAAVPAVTYRSPFAETP